MFGPRKAGPNATKDGPDTPRVATRNPQPVSRWCDRPAILAWSRYRKNGYKVVKPAIGLTVSSVPEERKTIKIDGEDHVEFNRITYRPFFRDGQVAFRVVKVS